MRTVGERDMAATPGPRKRRERAAQAQRILEIRFQEPLLFLAEVRSPPSILHLYVKLQGRCQSNFPMVDGAKAPAPQRDFSGLFLLPVLPRPGAAIVIETQTLPRYFGSYTRFIQSSFPKPRRRRHSRRRGS